MELGLSQCPFPTPSNFPPAHFRPPFAPFCLRATSLHNSEMSIPLLQTRWPPFSPRLAAPIVPTSMSTATAQHPLPLYATISSLKKQTVQVQVSKATFIGARRALQPPAATIAATPARGPTAGGSKRQLCAPGAHAGFASAGTARVQLWQRGAGNGAVPRAPNPLPNACIRPTSSVLTGAKRLAPPATASAGSAVTTRKTSGSRVNGPKRTAANARERVRMRVLSKGFTVSPTYTCTVLVILMNMSLIVQYQYSFGFYNQNTVQ